MLNDGLFVRIPKDLNFENVGALVKSKIPESPDNGYSWFYPPDNQEPVNDSYWVWISKNPIKGSQNKAYSVQREIAAEKDYQDCRAREVIAGLVAEYSRSGTFLCEDFWTRCLDTQDGYQVVVGFGRSGLDVKGLNFNNDDIGVLGLLRWRPAEVRSSVLGSEVDRGITNLS
jgi:hypothetical protein